MNPEPTGHLRGNHLVLHRRFRAPITDVWTSITDSASTARWFGRWEGTPGAGNQIRVQMGFEEGSPWLTKTIDVCDAPRRLVLSSVGSSMVSRLELALTTTNDGCELEFIQHDVDRAKVGDLGPGWEYYLDCLVASRDHQPLPAFDAYYPAQKAYFASLG
ncbi:MAG TPA: SRPBCC family protein [Kofleriaceae bacterium]|jgi:uncharacterized protein YndB with AHSA1/START domain